MITRRFRQLISKVIAAANIFYLRHFRHVDIGDHCCISWRARIDHANPRGVHIGSYTRVNTHAIILAHDFSHGDPSKMWGNTTIGHHCVIGGWALILPDVTLGNHVFVGAGSVVTKNVPDHCIIAGNPARIIRRGTIINDHTQIEEKGERVKE